MIYPRQIPDHRKSVPKKGYMRGDPSIQCSCSGHFWCERGKWTGEPSGSVAMQGQAQGKERHLMVHSCTPIMPNGYAPFLWLPSSGRLLLSPCHNIAQDAINESRAEVPELCDTFFNIARFADLESSYKGTMDCRTWYDCRYPAYLVRFIVPLITVRIVDAVMFPVTSD
jgi:hypothetical protein